MTLRAVVEEIERRGPVPFDVFLEAALYGADGQGFFAAGGGAGRRADFITSPEVGPLFGAVVARALDDEWLRLGRPDPFVVVEAGAGRGALARAVLDAGPACLGALRYIMVERSPALAEQAGDLVPVEPAANVLAGVGDPDDAGATPAAGSGSGPVFAVLDDLPAVGITGVVLANELLDNVPFRLYELTDQGWCEVRVGLDGDEGSEAQRAGGGAAAGAPDGPGGPPALVEVLVEVDTEVDADLRRLAPEAPTGARVPRQSGAAAWLRRALGLLEAGRIVVIDYADTTAAMAARPWREWLRTYRAQERGGHPLDHPGDQDVTCEVAIDQLARVRRLDADAAQGEWLRARGIEELVDEARATWHERAAVGDLEALRARSRVGEAEALLDPVGLGAFRVLEWQVGSSRSG